MMPQPISGGDARREAGLSPPQPAGERWRHVYRLFREYWTSSDWKVAWPCLIFLILVQFVVTYGFVLFNRWQQDFFNSVEQREVARFLPLMLTLVAIWALQMATSLSTTFVGMTLSIRWRGYLTEKYLGRWMSRDRFIEIERLRLIDNPDQRIAEDIEKLTAPGVSASGSGLLNIALALLNAVIGSITFGSILLETSESIRLPLPGMTIDLPGSMLWYAAIYALAGSIVMALVGRPYIRAVMGQQHRAGDFRAGLLHVRRNAPQIGFAGAVGVERASLTRSFDNIRRNYRSVIVGTLGIGVVQGLYERIGGILPYFLLVPRYFAGAISFGQVMSGRDAFSQMVGYLSYFVQVYGTIGQRIADLNRLKALDDAIDSRRPRGIAFASGGADSAAAIVATGLALHRPHGAPLLAIGDWTVRPGERWLVEGPSGAGKSTLLRALAGLWPDGAGSVAMSDREAAMFVPQRLYLPMGTLKAAVCFPDATDRHDDATIEDLLRRARLSEHVADLHALRLWQDELSPGEQQRLALARILLHRPSLLVLDEATSALDPDNARYFHEQLLAELPGVTLVSVVHDETLRHHHTHALSIRDGTAAHHAIGAE